MKWELDKYSRHGQSDPVCRVLWRIRAVVRDVGSEVIVVGLAPDVLVDSNYPVMIV